ncbi:restriction endonuclease subunit S [Helicobacter pylori]|uniref:Type-1 restriction enzyme specificityprotein MPN_089 n=2 Tax=Helicobacter pylori TaxID=210 RepID=A0AAD1G3Y2_HELPX|nr:restriction endonuclease subunit S [Helicobacter pylori]AVV96306.1 restriction endonuclease subunit S [Helicobacter pylori]BBI22922.1 putative type-1 restriction enzyme specificityprotein MPN_089 [Helicobacter pylori]SQJ05429.1 type I restriction-modification methylase [Helicobacter pylori NCTC 11637 = CCUG 17874 = ATCC 43504 = JCM 12093]
MHKIERLLQTLAPKGVEFRKLGEVINIFKGKQLNKELLLDYGEYPVMNGGIHASGYWNEYNTDYPKIIISQGGASAGYVNYMTSKFWAGAHCYAIELNSEKLNYKFLYYFLKNSQTILMKSQFGAGIPALNKADIETLTIPIPPLEIQQEIVKILDAFTELNTELNTRKKQYQYYQNMLLDFNDINQNHKDAKMSAKPYPKRLKTLLQTLAPKGVEFRKLGEVCDFQKGKSITKKAVTFGKVPVISGGRQPAYYHNEANRSGETIAISSSGVYAGYVSYWDIPVFLADSFSVSPKQKTLMPKYLFHYLTTQQDAIHATKSTGGIPHVYSKDLQNFLIPIPPLEIQQEIVKILDQFSILTTDLLAGIPAEIKARKKQYEYYREKLLTFKPLTPIKKLKNEF